MKSLKCDNFTKCYFSRLHYGQSRSHVPEEFENRGREQVNERMETDNNFNNLFNFISVFINLGRRRNEKECSSIFIAF